MSHKTHFCFPLYKRNDFPLCEISERAFDAKEIYAQILLFQGFMFCLQQVACIFSIVAAIVGGGELQEASQILTCLSDVVYCRCVSGYSLFFS